MQDIRFQEADPLVDRHVGDLFRREIGQLDACLVNRREFLLLQHVGRHVADGDDQVLRWAAILDDGNRVDAEIAVIAT